MGIQGSFAYGGIQKSYSFPHFAAGRLAGSINRVQGPDIPCENVLIKAPLANTGIVYVGGNDVSSVVGYPLEAGNAVLLPINNINLIYYVGTVAADSLRYILWR